MTAPFRVDISTGEGEKRLAFLRNRFANPKRVLEGSVRQLIRRAIIQQRNTRGAYGGSVWPPLSDYTIRRKEREGVIGKGPLRFTDTLYNSLLKVGDEHRFEEITQRGYTLRSMAVVDRGDQWDGFPYGRSHQFGLGNVPQRQIIPDPLPASFIRDLRRVVRGFLIGVEFGVE